MIRDIQDEIMRLKKENDVCILAHLYQNDAILEVADYTGDSFALAKLAQTVPNKTVLMCGVRFMAETVKMLAPDKRVLLSNRTPAKAEALAKELGCQAGDNLQAAQCAYIFLGVKPHLMADMLRPLQPVLAARQDGFVLVSMAAGLSMDRLQEMAGGPYPIFRILPNLAAQVGESMIPWLSLIHI